MMTFEGLELRKALSSPFSDGKEIGNYALEKRKFPANNTKEVRPQGEGSSLQITKAAYHTVPHYMEPSGPEGAQFLTQNSEVDTSLRLMSGPTWGQANLGFFALCFIVLCRCCLLFFNCFITVVWNQTHNISKIYMPVLEVFRVIEPV